MSSNSGTAADLSVSSAGSGVAEIVLSHLAEGSVLHGPDAHLLKPFVVAGRKRLATCSGVSWFAGYHLAVVNLYGQHLRIYRFDPGDRVGGHSARLALVHELPQALSLPEDVAVSPDGRWLAIAHTISEDLGITLHRIDPSSLAPEPVGELLRPGGSVSAFHNVTFSPDSRHLIFTQIAGRGNIEVVRIASNSRDCTCLVENKYDPLKPKAVGISQDGRFAAVAMAENASATQDGAKPGGLLSVHAFDAANGVIGANAVAELPEPNRSLGLAENCTFLPKRPGKPYRILVTDQIADAVTMFDFDAEAGSLSYAGVFASGLSFPHGLDISADNKFAAVTAYGDDYLHIIRVPPTGGRLAA